MKIAIVTGAWKRPEILRIFCWYWTELSKQIDDAELTVYCATSEALSSDIVTAGVPRSVKELLQRPLPIHGYGLLLQRPPSLFLECCGPGYVVEDIPP